MKKVKHFISLLCAMLLLSGSICTGNAEGAETMSTPQTGYTAPVPAAYFRPSDQQDTLFTIQTFFDYNLNVSETSRQLFVHRNTLVYRLEKIHERTGLDLRDFDDAIVLKVALMVKRYLDTRPDRF